MGKTLLVIVGDHGIQAPCLYENIPTPSKQEQLAKITLILSGGISEFAAKNCLHTPSETRS